jgi:putative endonuclease
VNTHVVGDWGEQVAAQHLERTGWTILQRHFRVGRKEIDLVARKDGVVAFIEVKSRRRNGFGHPLAAIVDRKRGVIRQVAEGWIARFGEQDLLYRFDAIAVVRPNLGGVRLQHVENAWGI